MAVIIPQVITPSKASGAQIIDGSLKFDGAQSLNHLTTSGGNLKTWTWSGWLKRGKDTAGTSNQNPWAIRISGNNQQWIRFESSGNTLRLYLEVSSSIKYDLTTNQTFREFSGGWYHIVNIFDSTQATESDRVKLYINGERVTSFSSATYPSQNQDGLFNTNNEAHYIAERGDGNNYFTGQLTNINYIDGQALGPEYFGFTDPLTNTWKPKKYTGTFGTNGFYLPLDGNSPIGEDKSGQGNNFTPVNFGGSVALDSPLVSGARPILNTTQGGSQAGVGVFGSKQNVGYAVTVYNDGGGNKYYIDGVKQDTVTGLIRGATYTFDTSDSSVSSHPFRFSATSNGSHGGGSEYTNGVAAITGAATTITVPHDAPNTLYYYCTSHSGMGADITGITTNEKLADQYASNCVLALPLVGSKDDVSASIACTSTTKTTAVSGNAASNSTSSNFYGSSFYFDGTDDYHDSTITALASRDFTIEFWFMSTATDGYQTLFEYGDHTSNGIYITLRDGDAIGARSYNGQDISNATISSPSHNTPNDKWHHIAITRESNTAKLFINGKYIGNKTWSTSYTPTKVRLGHSIYSAGSSEDLTGYIQDVRIYDGVVKYTGTTVNEQSFVVPSRSPDILPDTPSGVSGGSKLAKIAEGAVSFNGSDGRLNLYPNADFAFGTGDFTVECYVYSNNRGTYDYIIDGRNSSQTTGTWSLGYGYAGGNGRLEFASGSSTLLECPAHLNPETNKWTHIAVTRSGTSLRMFIDGVLATSATDSTNFSTSPTNSSVGTRYSNQHYWDGAISNIRVVKGTALYTSNFVPSLEPLTKTSQSATESEVKLLCCKSNTVAGTAVTAPGMGGINDGTVWSTTVSGGLGPYANGFDGNLTSTSMFPRNQNAQGNLVFAGGLPCDAVYCNTYSSSGTEFFTDSASSPTSVNTSSSFAWVDLPADATVLNQIKGTGGAGYDAFAIRAFRKDGVTLLDPLSPTGGVAAANFTPFNTDINTVRGQETGYATLNPLDKGTSSTLSDGNLKFSGVSSAHRGVRSSIRPTNKVYAEMVVYDNETGFGFATGTTGLDSSTLVSGKWAIYNNQLRSNGSSIASITTLSVGDLIQVAYDPDSNKAWIGRNNVWYDSSGSYSGNPATGANPTFTISEDVFIYTHSYNAYDTSTNFGQKPFKFPPPDGFQPLNTANARPVNVISRPDQYVGVTTYTGDGNSSGRRINIGFRPDLIWLKSRGSGNHGLYDSVRGPDKRLQADGTAAEDTVVFPGASDFGFDFGSETYYNASSTNYVAWTWKAGGNKNTFNVDGVGYATAAAAGLTAGSVTPTGASVGTKQGFSIIKWTAPDPQDNSATIPHGLTQKPDLWAVKSLDGARDWIVYTEQVDGSLDFTHFNNTDAKANSSATAPTATTFGVYGNDINTAGEDQIAYLWHDVPGLQKFGSYEGNTTTPAFIETGFRPAIIWIKAVDQTWYWNCSDAERSPINPSKGNFIQFNISGAEGAASGNNNLDILSNGFKIRSTTAQSEPTNVNGQTYIYGAWAEAPSVDLFGGGANAR
jgi:hypothetical protein